MKVVIVAKTRMGGGACIGAITFTGQSIRLIAADAETNDHFNQEYEIGDVWDVEYVADPAIEPPHVENIIVRKKTKLPSIDNVVEFIEKQMPPVCGSVELLYDGVVKATKAGAQYIAARTGIPPYSTMFWRPDKPLKLCDDAKRIRYQYPTIDGGRTITFVGFQEPLLEIPADTLLRISLAHWWRPIEKPDGELRCYVQLSGWYIDDQAATVSPRVSNYDGSSTGWEEPNMERAQDLLKQVFGHKKFRPMQGDVVENVLHRRDSVVVMPTGSGKSICYQLPALLFPGLTVVVSPLISLMQDQVEQLRQHGISAAFLNSTLSYEQYIQVTRQIRTGNIQLLYAAPESLLRPETLFMLQNCRVDCLTIDEAHCISQWGHDFRPEYRQLIDLRRRLRQATCLAVTATATERVRQDIKQTLQINSADEFTASFDRKNLFLAVDSKHEGVRQILDYLQDHQGEAGIIYCNTKKEVSELVGELVSAGWPALPYHADLDKDVRARNQRKFIFEEGQIIIATIAFGMGINKSNVRFIVHYGLPKNLESYYQQIGRAGRDGLRADCLLLYSYDDINTIRYFIRQQNESQQPGGWVRLQAMIDFAETVQCRRIPLLAYFRETAKRNSCNMCDNCESDRIVAKEDITVAAQKFLSCIVRTGQRFGTAHIIKVLRGSQEQKVLRWKHDQLPTYNIGREYSKRQWQNLASQFLGLGLLQKDNNFGSLQLTDNGEAVLHGAKVYGYIPQRKTAKARTRRKDYEKEFDSRLFDLLRSKRTELAQQAGLPPYIIFSDYSLAEMATYFPQTESAFIDISGVGNYKLEKYAGEFLPIICAYCQQNDIAEYS